MNSAVNQRVILGIIKALRRQTQYIAKSAQGW